MAPFYGTTLMALQEYRAKRRFQKTPEPAGKRAQRAAQGKLKFVVQKHAATRLHYDWRLELDGVLKSWAVPKGPALDPHEKRLAVEVEDHPLEYATFEGVIPQGEYGGGEVIVWDRGTWSPQGDPHAGLAEGKLEFTVSGEKLHGAWVLLRLRGGRNSRAKNNWLLLKKRDEFARPLSEYDITESLPVSVKSGRRVEELKPGRAVKAKQQPTAPRKATATRRAPRRAKKPAGKKAQLPEGIEVQLALLADHPPVGDEWVHEVKFDGYRMLCYVQTVRGKKQVRLLTRNQQDWTQHYPALVAAAEQLAVDSAILDGEVVALLPSGVTSFQSLQNAGKGIGAAKLAYYLFDLLYLDGYDLRSLPLLERKQQLHTVLADTNETSPLQYSEHFETDGAEFLRHCCQLGLEGIISKRREKPYLSGRTEHWRKTKCVGREELVIGGFTISTAVPRGIGALLVGYYAEGQFVYAGRVGTGFNTATLIDLRRRLSEIQQKECPFASVPAKERGKEVRWVRPELVAEVEFTGWTDSGILRHPSFQGLREDKPAKQVTTPASLKLPAEPTMGKKKAATAKAKPADKTGAAPNITVRLTHPERVLYPETGLTKLGLATYYAQIGEWILPHVLNRPLSLVRCPSGAAGKCFYQKHPSAGMPPELGRVDIQEKNEVEEYVYIKDLDGLLSLAQLSILEIHPWGSRRDSLDKPDYVVIDLDPDPSVPWQRVIDGALAVRDLLEQRGLVSFVKTTGGKGLHVVFPLAPRRAEWDEVKAFARGIAEELVAAEPSRYTATMSKAARKGKIFVDYLRNDRGSTAIAPYSTRAKPNATVATPLAWEELSPALASDHFHVGNVVRRLESLQQDPWQDFYQVKQTLPKNTKR